MNPNRAASAFPEGISLCDFSGPQLRVIDALLRSSPDVVFVHDREGHFLYVGVATTQMVGHPSEEILGKTCTELGFPPEVTQQLDQDRERMFAQRGPVSGELLSLTLQGARAFAYTFSPVSDSEGEQCAALCIARDVTERREAERERLRLVASVTDSEGRLRALVNNMVDGVITIDTQGTIQTVNPATLRLFGYPREELIGRNVRILMPEPYASEHDNYLTNYLQTGQAQIIGIGREVTGLRRDGTTFPLDLAVAEMRIGDQPAFVGTIHDLTERKRLEQQFLQAQKMEGLGRMAGGIAHDYNNLLSVILGYAELVEEGLSEESGLLPSLRNIQGAANRASTLTRQLLAFARNQVTQTKVVSVNTLLRELTSLLKSLMGAQVEMVVLFSEEEGFVRIDPSQMEQVLINLAVNARDAMPEGGKLVLHAANILLTDPYRGELGRMPLGVYCQITVTDTGIGMSDAVRERVFEPFFTTKEKGKGTGLGLATCYGIVKQAGGYIWVQSAVGAGTTVKVHLPRVEAPAAERASERKAAPVGGTETVLVVEDEPLVRDLTVRALQKHGYTVLAAENGADALRVLGEHSGPIHMVITDAVMPLMGGRELIERLRTLYPGVKALLASGYTEEDFDAQVGLPESAAFLQKPFTSAALLRRVREVLGED